MKINAPEGFPKELAENIVNHIMKGNTDDVEEVTIRKMESPEDLFDDDDIDCCEACDEYVNRVIIPLIESEATAQEIHEATGMPICLAAKLGAKVETKPYVIPVTYMVTGNVIVHAASAEDAIATAMADIDLMPTCENAEYVNDSYDICDDEDLVALKTKMYEDKRLVNVTETEITTPLVMLAQPDADPIEEPAEEPAEKPAADAE